MSRFERTLTTALEVLPASPLAAFAFSEHTASDLWGVLAAFGVAATPAGTTPAICLLHTRHFSQKQPRAPFFTDQRLNQNLCYTCDLT